MFDIETSTRSIIEKFVIEQNYDYIVQTNSSEERTLLLILRDLLRIGWSVTIHANKISILPPDSYDKQVIRNSMEIKRHESILNSYQWIQRKIAFGRENLANGEDVWNSDIEPEIEVCYTQKQFDLFRLYRFYWSSPFSDYVGRRMKFIIRDKGLPNRPVIGIAALGSSIIHIPARDTWIGWNKQTRTQNLINTMDAYIIGALPPYNYLLGGKLITYVLGSNEIRELYRKKYSNSVTQIAQRTENNLACIFTTSLYGRSSQYNRMNYEGHQFIKKIGETKGYGTLHLTDETFNSMKLLLQSRGIEVLNRFGDGPSWRMRVIRTASEIIGIDPDFLLRHSFKRNIYVIPLAENYVEYLQGNEETLKYYDKPLDSIVDYWKKRWLFQRKQNPQIKENVLNFNRNNFSIA